MNTSTKRYISEKLSSLFSISSLIMKPVVGLRILMYHSINRQSDKLIENHNDNIFTVNLSSFESQLLSIANSDCQVTNLKEGINNINDNIPSIAITFDDGFNDNLINAAPLLIDYNFPFTIFISTNNLDKPNYLSVSDVKELSKYKGVTIGSHGVTHTPFTELSKNELINELIKSKAVLEDISGKEISTISYPHGLVNNNIIQEVEAAGYEYAFSSKMGINNNTYNKYLLKRTTILSFDKEKEFNQKLRGYWDWYGWLV